MKVFILWVVIIGTLFSSTELEDVSLQLKWKYQFQFAGFIAAKEKGFYKEVGLDVDLLEYDDSIDTLERIEKGEVEFAVTDSSLILEAVKGAPVTAIMAIYQKSPYVVMALKSSNINRLEDLHGKKFAIYGDINGMVIRSMLDAHKIDFISEPVGDNLTRLQKKEVDAIIAYLPNEPYVAKEKGIDFTLIEPSRCGFSCYGDILFTSKEFLAKRPEIVAKMREASSRGFKYAFAHIDEMVELIYHKYNTQNKSKEALRHEAELLKKMSGPDKDFGKLCKRKIGNIAHVYSFMKFGNYNYDNLNHFIYKEEKPDIELTPEELSYLGSKKIRVCVHSDLYPLEFSKEGKHKGITADYLKLITKGNPFSFEYIFTKSDSDALGRLKALECDLKTIVPHVPNAVSEYLDETDLFLSDPLALITKDDKLYIDNVKLLKGKKIVVNSQVYKNFLTKYYPSLDVTLVRDMETAIGGVNNKTFYGLFTPSIFANTVIQKHGLKKFKVSMKLEPYVLEAAIGISKKEPQLLSIMNKLLKLAPEDEIDNIKTRWSIQTHHHTQDYSLIWKILLVAFILLLVLLYKIRLTSRHSAELEEQKKRLEATQLNLDLGQSIAHIGIWNLDYKENKLEWTLGAYEILDASSETMNPTPEGYMEYVHPDDKMKLRQVYRDSIEGKINTYFLEYRIVLKDGTLKYVEERCQNFFNADGSIEKLVGTVLDITSRKEAEIKLEQLTSQLEERVRDEVEKNKQHQLIMLKQSRYAQMGEMITMIAHQWRQPLNNLSMIIQGVALKYKMGKADDKLMHKLSHDSTEQITQMSQTIDDFRDFFKPDKEPEIFCVNESILNTTKLLRPIFESKQVALRLDLGEDISVKGFANELGQALINILNNAKDVLLEKRGDKDKFIDITLEQDNHDVVICISDNGGGISQEIMENIFDPYFTTKQEKNGTGLGLYMSKTIIEDHCGGELSVANGSDGAVFKVRLKGKL